MYTDFNVNSSSRFPFTARTNKQTDATERPTHIGGLHNRRGWLQCTCTRSRDHGISASHPARFNDDSAHARRLDGDN